MDLGDAKERPQHIAESQATFVEISSADDGQQIRRICR